MSKISDLEDLLTKKKPLSKRIYLIAFNENWLQIENVMNKLMTKSSLTLQYTPATVFNTNCSSKGLSHDPECSNWELNI